ncbi:MAG: protein translocase subunit SecF, partial [Deltaproteobacteria bacterium]|nr:protein translocase subunit SecF [Deltaproteobacteria bacterium]
MELIPPNTKIDFIGNRGYAYLFSAVLAVLALISIPIRGSVQLGIDFTGGVMVQVLFKKHVVTEEVRAALEGLSESLVVQGLGGGSGGEEFVIRMETPGEESENFAQKVQAALDAKFGKNNAEIRGLELVGPKVGRDLQESAIWATVIALGMLLVYMAFRFTFTMGLGAIACLV